MNWGRHPDTPCLANFRASLRDKMNFLPDFLPSSSQILVHPSKPLFLRDFVVQNPHSTNSRLEAAFTSRQDACPTGESVEALKRSTSAFAYRQKKGRLISAAPLAKFFSNALTTESEEHRAAGADTVGIRR
jgi:hypothetical protein